MRIQRMTVQDAAQAMGMSEATLQAGLIQGRFPWGYAVQTHKDRWSYWINAKKFREIERLPEEEQNEA